MTLEEIKTKICDLRCSVEELQEQAQELWRETEDERTEKVADYLDNELGYIAYRLSEEVATSTILMRSATNGGKQRLSAKSKRFTQTTI